MSAQSLQDLLSLIGAEHLACKLSFASVGPLPGGFLLHLGAECLLSKSLSALPVKL